MLSEGLIHNGLYVLKQYLAVAHLRRNGGAGGVIREGGYIH